MEPPQELRDLLDALLEALNARDFHALADLIEPDLEFRSMLAVAEGEIYHGIDGLRTWAEQIDATWDEFRAEFAEIRVTGPDDAVLATRNVGTARLSGVPLDSTRGMIVTRRNGRAWKVAVYADPAEAFRAVGVNAGDAEVIRGHFAAFRDGGLDAVAAFWHEDIEWRAVQGAADDVGVIRGHDALRRYYADWTETFDELGAEVEEILFDADGRVAAVVHHFGRGRASALPVEGRYYVVCRVGDGLILGGREYATRAETLDAVTAAQ